MGPETSDRQEPMLGKGFSLELSVPPLADGWDQEGIDQRPGSSNDEPDHCQTEEQHSDCTDGPVEVEAMSTPTADEEPQQVSDAVDFFLSS